MLQKAILQIDTAKGVRNSGAGSRFSTGESVTEDALKKLKQAAKSVAAGVEARQDKALINDGMIMVQYNPASIKYRAATPSQNTSSQDVGADTENIMSIPRASTADMSFSLVFHQAGDADESVREQMELVMNMIYDSPTKKVKFAWGKIEATGKLVSFSGEYDMFDEIGRPISGHMDITIRTQISVKQLDQMLYNAEGERKNKELS